jgi:hypothetical protein
MHGQKNIKKNCLYLLLKECNVDTPRPNPEAEVQTSLQKQKEP